MKRFFNLFIFVALLALIFGAQGIVPAKAAPVPAPQLVPVPVVPPVAPAYTITGRARWGATGFEAVLFTPGNPSPTGVQLNPTGTPAWSVGNYHAFEFTYVMATQVATWKIDFNRDSDFLDSNESTSSTSPTLAGYVHTYLNLWMSGSANAPGTVDVQNFTVNGTNLGSFVSNGNTTPIEWTWTDSSGYFGDVTVTGEYRMSANGSAGESNRMWVRLGDQQCAPITISPDTLPDEYVGILYDQMLTASGGSGGYSFAVTGGTLPPGLTLETNGQLHGTLSTAGPYSFTVTATGSNGCTGVKNYSLTITVFDNTPPVVTVPSDITAEATSAAGAVVNFVTSATDETSPANPAVSCNWPSGSTFPIGMTPVTCSATDDAMNTGYGYFNVTVQDTTDPITYFDSTPAALTNSTSATFTFHATDAVSAPANINSYCYVDTGLVWNWGLCTSPLNLSGLSDGLHTIWIYSVDQAGNSEWAPVLNAFYVWTVDTTIPTFGLSFIGPYEATGPSGAVAAYSVNFTDANGIASQSCTPASGSLFPIGSTQVNCTATDNAGNIANAFFYLVVQDTTGPQLNLPADITVPQVTPAGAAVNFSVSATDLVSPLNPPVYCDWNSGDIFPVGTTTVHCSATDDYSNTSNGSFNVTVTATANLLQKSDFGGAYIFPFPWIPSGFRPPYGGALDCKIYVSGPCSVRFNASDRNLALAALQRVNRVGSAGDTISFGLYSRAQNVPNNGLYRVEITFFNGYRKLATYTVNFNAGTHDFELGTSMVNAPANYTRIDYRFVYQKVAGTAWFDDAFLYFVSAP